MSPMARTTTCTYGHRTWECECAWRTSWRCDASAQLFGTLHGKGKMKVGDEFVNESVIGSLFRGKILAETMVGNTKAIIPEITGTAYVTAFHDFVLDPADPFPNG